ncbi:MAG: FkbM family methyltransferase [Microcoleaceae cyanobacterium MO_207.B10]|nr:FkbM family methyltransferase [Microcoleaceae cyanobacterium MO_207.B10]
MTTSDLTKQLEQSRLALSQIADVSLSQLATYFDVSNKKDRDLSSKLLFDFFIEIIKSIKPTYFFDIGSYDATNSIFVKKAFSKINCFAFEANHNNYKEFKDRKEIKKYSIEYKNLAVSNYTGTVELNIPVEINSRKVGKNPQTASLLERKQNAKYEVIQTDCTKLDDFCISNGINLEHPQNLALWIDVEGAAILVIEGARKCLTNTSLIYIEVEELQHWKEEVLVNEVMNELIASNFIPIARDFERPTQYNMLFIHSNYFNQIKLLLYRFFRRLSESSSTYQPNPIKASSEYLTGKVLFHSAIAIARSLEEKASNPENILTFIIECLERKSPFSLIRINDGEGCLMGYETSFSYEEVFENLLEIQFGKDCIQNLTEDVLRSLKHQMITAIHNCNVLGLPFNFIHRRNNIACSHCFIELSIDFVSSIYRGDILICSANIHRSLYTENQLLLLLKKLSGKIGFITGRDISKFLSDNGIEEYFLIEVPAEQRFSNKKDSSHFPKRFKEIMKLISTSDEIQGRLFFVGAGVLGKIYCNAIKQNGGMAIDIGSILDAWAEVPTRGYIRKMLNNK